MTSATLSLAAPPRVMPHAGHALLGIGRLALQRFSTINYWFALAAMLGVLVVLSIPAARSEATAHRNFVPWAAGFYACFLVPILSFISAAGALRDDLSGPSVDYLLTRPLPRPLFVAFRYLAHTAAMQISFLFGFLTLAAIGLYWGVPDLATGLSRILLTQVCGVAVFSAAGFFCGLLTSRYIILGLLYAVIIEQGLGSVPTKLLNQISLFRHLLAVAGPAVGDGGWAFTRAGVGGVPSATTAALVLAGVTVATIAVTAFFFSVREFAGSGAREA